MFFPSGHTSSTIKFAWSGHSSSLIMFAPSGHSSNPTILAQSSHSSNLLHVHPLSSLTQSHSCSFIQSPSCSPPQVTHSVPFMFTPSDHSIFNVKCLANSSTGPLTMPCPVQYVIYIYFVYSHHPSAQTQCCAHTHPLSVRQPSEPALASEGARRPGPHQWSLKMT